MSPFGILQRLSRSSDTCVLTCRSTATLHHPVGDCELGTEYREQSAVGWDLAITAVL